MEEKPPDEPDTSLVPKDNGQGCAPSALEQKKTVYWMGGVMSCFSTVLSLFSKADLSPTKDDDWEVPFAELSESLYLGSGAQGIVFRSQLKGEIVAVKQLREKTETNIKHLRKLNHDNIVRFRGISTDGAVPCIIMEYCQYGPLFNFIHRGAVISAKQTFAWAKEIAQGMAYLHSHQIIHRDLKSPNILIADHLTVKVSDFGTAREWNNVSATMSFTGTVAWMAPEVIRHEPCSEKVDVWSYGVVLWELLTQEIPYKNMETHAIMWGVGTDTLSLPIPPSCPENLQILLLQCWRRVPRSRPSFKMIAANLEFTGHQFTQSHGDCFSATQITWRKEIKEGLKFIVRSTAKSEAAIAPSALRMDDMRHAKDVRQVYEQQLVRANELYMEVCSLRLQLEAREKLVAERERALEACRCSIKKNLKYLHHEDTTSSDNIKFNVAQNETIRKKREAQVVLKLNKQDKVVSVAADQGNVAETLQDVSQSPIDNAGNNNLPTFMTNTTPKIQKPKDTSIKLKEVVVEQNGNIVKNVEKQLSYNGNIPDVAQV